MTKENRKRITIVGLGSGNEDDLTLGALKALRQGYTILRTGKHGVIPFLKAEGIPFVTLDDIYNKFDTFEEAYSSMVEKIIGLSKTRNIVLGVPGHPFVGERLVPRLISRLDKDDYELKILPGVSRADTAIAALGQYPGPLGIKAIVAPELELKNIDTDISTVVLDIDSPLAASQVKLVLLRAYPSEHQVYLCKEMHQGEITWQKLPLYSADRMEEYDHTTCLYIPALSLKDLENFGFEHLVSIMESLRCPDGCPWDKEQTHDSLKQYLLEETYELLEAIDKKDYDNIIEELGDVLLQVVFHSQIGAEHGEFDIRDVTTGICRKMIHRHPHIFGDILVDGSDQVRENWEQIKKREKGIMSYTQMLEVIPSNLPALMRAYKVQKKAALSGFDWDLTEDAIKKMEEELMEFKEVCAENDQDRINEELGDLLFSLVNVSRFVKIQPELALKGATEKFIRRFRYIEDKASKPMEEMTLKEMDDLWNQAKVAFSRDMGV